MNVKIRLLITAIFTSFIFMVHAQEKNTGEFLEVNGIKLYYEKYGKGAPLILLHGWTQTSSFWQPYIKELSDRFEVYVIDLRGHGKSSPLTKNFSIQQAAVDIGLFIQKLGLKEVRAIGLSYGGLVLLELAAGGKYPLRELVLIGTSYQYDGKEAQKNKPAFTYDGMDSSFKAYLQLHHAGGEKQIRALFDPELNYRIHLPEDQLRKIRASVFIINGDSDEIAGISQAVRMRELIPGSKLWIIPGAGHLAITDKNTQAFITEVKNFFSGNLP